MISNKKHNLMHHNSIDIGPTYGHLSLSVPVARLIAFYLPQFHPTPENDRWWGTGFTEWTNVAKARPLFRDHYQPRVPADLGFYDLRLPEVRAEQAALARDAGIEGFCYWHYWFAGKRMLERPFNEVLRLGEPNFPFCLGWANHNWTGVWHGAPNRMLIEQTYPGQADYEKHFYAVLEAFHDPRYIRVRGKPVFVIYRPKDLPSAVELIELWQLLAAKNGLTGIHFVANVLPSDQPYDYRSNGFAAGIADDSLRVNFLNAWQRSLEGYQARNGHNDPVHQALLKSRAFVRAISLKGRKELRLRLSKPAVFDYAEAMLHAHKHVTTECHSYPCVIPNWDHSPRAGNRSVIFHNSTPELFRKHMRKAVDLVIQKPFEDRLLFVKAWNEWAEGNYLEPDLKFGHAYLDVVRSEVYGRQPDGPAGVSAPAASNR
jgi:hypothetical protein